MTLNLSDRVIFYEDIPETADNFTKPPDYWRR